VPKFADTADVRALQSQGAQLVEVLPAAPYAAEHLPGAVNIPLADLMDASTTQRLDPARPTVVYCYDHECDLSARGARLLEELGFTDVYDYAASKTAWMADGLPVEGDTPDSSRAGAIARDVPTCSFRSRVADLPASIDDDGLCVVTSDDGVVLGVVRGSTRRLPADTPLAAVMQTAPPTVRPSITADQLAESMSRDARPYVLVTRYDGTLLGVIHRRDLHGQ
jgi:rhodanese-related sulfurtransferase